MKAIFSHRILKINILHSDDIIKLGTENLYMRRFVVIIMALTSISILSLAQGTGDSYSAWSKMETRPLYDKGISYLMKKNMPDSALVCFTLLASRYPDVSGKKKEMEVCVAAMNTAGQIYMDYYHNLNKAYQLFLQSRDLSRENGMNDILSFNYLCLANLKFLRNNMSFQNRNYGEVISDYRNAFHFAMVSKSPNAMVPAFINLVYVSFDEGKLASVSDELRLFRTTRLSSNTNSLQFARNLCLAMEAWLNKTPANALHYIERMQKTIDRKQSKRAQASLLMIYHETKYNYFLQLGKEDEAMMALRAYEEAADSLNSDNDLLDAYRYYYEFYNKKGDITSSNKYELLFYRLKDKFVDEMGMPTLAQTEFLYRLGKVQEQVKEDAYAKRVQTIILVGLAVILLLIILILFQLVRKYRREKENNKFLYENTLKMISSGVNAPGEKTSAVQSDADTRIKYANSSLSSKDKDDLFRKIRSVMETSNEVYSEDFSLSRLSVLIGEQENHVSQAINEQYHGNFYSLLSEYRIREACRRFNSSDFSNYTIEAVARSVGFKSRTNFARNFKMVTGMTPSAYQKEAAEHLHQA